MTQKERAHAALEGRPVDRPPVTALYNMLYYQDHFCELTGLAAHEQWRWRYAEPDEHLRLYRGMLAAAPLEFLQPQGAPSCEEREQTEVAERDGAWFVHNRRHDTWAPVATRSGHPTDYTHNEAAHVRDEAEARERIVATPHERLLAAGHNDYLDAVVAALGEDHFILSGGVAGPFWQSHFYLGLTNLLMLAVEKPALVDTTCRLCQEQNLEHIRFLAVAGGDAIYVDDAIATSDMISVPHYERFCLPYMVETVREIHRLGQKAIIIYYGGVMDRLEQIASIGADGFLMEASMKGYVNDIEVVAETIGHRVALFGNLDPVTVLQNASDAVLAAEVRRQAAAGRKARGFIMSPASPITPLTPLARVRRFLELGRTCWETR
jgi:uroporphyrinogen-III decarboxylase